jgi:Fe-S oxidoreductase
MAKNPWRSRMGENEIYLWRGCTSRRYLEDTLESLEFVLRKLGVDFEIVDEDEACCGSVMLGTGQSENAEANRDKMQDILKNKGVSNMVSACAGCTKMFREYYVEHEGYLKGVEHITEFVAENLDKLDFKEKDKFVVTYHDPCHLGRHLGVFEAPRRIINTLPNVELKEMKSNRDNSFCCGSGGGVRAYNKEFADESSALRLLEAKATGARYLITSCPFCERSFKSAQQTDDRVKDIKVMNILDFMRIFLE